MQTERPLPEEQEPREKQESNPRKEAYRLFHDDRVATASRQRDQWHRSAMVSWGITGISVAGLIYLGTLPKHSVQAYEVDRSTGRVAFVSESKEFVPSKEVWAHAKKSAFEDFVLRWRTVTSDPR